MRDPAVWAGPARAPASGGVRGHRDPSSSIYITVNQKSRCLHKFYLFYYKKKIYPNHLPICAETCYYNDASRHGLSIIRRAYTMKNYRVEYYNIDEVTGLQEDRPSEIHWFQRRGLSRRDITNMLMTCTKTNQDIVGHIYRNEQSIGLIEVRVSTVYKFTAVIISGRTFFKHQWRAA